MRKALLKMLPSARELERRINRGLALDLPKGFRRRDYPVVIDLHDLPYYGEPRRRRQLVHGLKKGGTTHFHRYATACIIRKGYRFTIAAVWVLEGESVADTVKRLLHEVHARGVKIRYLLLDREFYNVEVVRALEAGRRPFVIPVVHRGRTPKDLSRATGTRQFLRWKKSGWGQYSWRNPEGRRATVDICVSGRYYRDKKGRRRRQVLVFACWGIHHCPPLAIRETYRRRFGVETSYRQLESARMYTTSSDPVRRLLFVAIALILRNAWVWFHLMVLAERLPGGSVRLHLQVMCYEKMLHMLERFVEWHLGNETLMIAKAPP
jgi:putative transposase